MAALAGLPVRVQLDLSDDDIRRVAAAVVAEVAALVPAWLPDRPLSRDDAAAWLRVSAEQLRRWERSGTLVPARAGQIVRYTPAQLAAFLGGGDRGDATGAGQ